MSDGQDPDVVVLPHYGFGYRVERAPDGNVSLTAFKGDYSCLRLILHPEQARRMGELLRCGEGVVGGADESLRDDQAGGSGVARGGREG